MKEFTSVSMIFSFLIIFISNVPIFAQDNDGLAHKSIRIENGKNDSLVNIFIETNVSFTSSVNDNREQSNAGNGSLGMRFERSKIYGQVNFTVYSKNEEIETRDPEEYKLFGTNMLLPENNSGNINNFSFLLGIESFYINSQSNDEYEPFLSLKKLGIMGYFTVNNTNWNKDSVTIPITINSFGVMVTYTLLNLRLINESTERIKLIAFGGFQARRLGGDYAMDLNIELRKQFIGTEIIGFNGTLLGCRLEIGEFYGEMGVPWFPSKHNIAGFSGNQPFVSLGIKADLNISAQQIR